MAVAVKEAKEALGGLLHVYWPEAENWDGTTTPLVTFVPAGLTGDEVVSLHAYDAAGNQVVVDEMTVKQRPVIVLTRNERTQADGTLQPMTMGARSLLPPPCDEENPEGCDDGGGGNGGGPGGSNYSDYMRLDFARFYNDYEGWPNGGPEFRAKFTDYNASTDQTRTLFTLSLDQFNIKREYCDGRTLTFNKVLFHWDETKYPTYHVKWYESDSNDLLYNIPFNDIPFKLPPLVSGAVQLVSFIIKIGSDDDVLAGEAAIHVDTPSPQYYGTGDPDFQITRLP